MQNPPVLRLPVLTLALIVAAAASGCTPSGRDAMPSEPTTPTPPATPPTPTALAFTVQPSTTASMAAITPAVQVAVQDAAGNTVATATDSITVGLGSNPANGNLSGATTVAAVNGVATFADLRIDEVGSGYTLTAAARGLSGATSSGFAVTAGAAGRLAFTVQPTHTASGAAISPAVQVTVQDSAGNTVPDATTSITLAIGTNPAGGTLSGTTTVAAVNGIATFNNLRIDKSGTGYRLTAAASGLTGTTSAGFNVTAGPATTLAFTVQPTNTASGAAITPPVQVTVRDASGNTVSSATHSVTLAIGANPGSGTLSGTATVAAVNGVATFNNLRIDKPGAGYTLTATASGLTGATSTGFNVTVGTPATLAFTAQPGNTVSGAVITPPVQVTVRDAAGNPVSTATNAITVAIGTNPAGGTLAGTLTVAAVNGVATFNNLSINNAGSGYTLTAAASGLAGATSSAFSIVASSGVFRWQSVAPPAGHQATDLYAVSTAGGKVWASGKNGTILHYTDATGWVVQATGLTGSDGRPGPLYSIHMWYSTTENLIGGIAVGGDGSGMRFYYDGTTWTRQSSGTSTLMSVTSVGQDPYREYWACGFGGIVYRAYYPNAFNRWTPDFTTNDVQYCTGTTTMDVYAAGANGFLAHWDGTAWTSTGYTTNTTERIYGGTRCGTPSGTTGMWLAGGGGVIRYATAPFKTFTAQASGTTQPLFDMEAASCTDVYAVGANGTILRYDGSVWAAQSSGTINALTGIVIRPGSGDAWVVGSGGTILRGVR